jgi:hypothetical protein
VKRNLKRLLFCTAIAGGNALAISGLAQAQVVNTSFQNGANGYTGTFDRKISEKGGASDVNGSTVAQYFVDGFSPVVGATDASPDEQGLLRFDNIIGNGPGQIPAGATILDAKLKMTTSLAGNSQTSGPFGVAGLKQAFDASTTYFGNFTSATPFGSRGPWWQDGYATRPVGGFGFQVPGVPSTANVSTLVQGWASGGPNHGLVIQAGTSDVIATPANTNDAWSFYTTGFPFSDSRPKLEVSYTTAPVTMKTFQRGANGYTGDTMAIVRSGNNALINDSDPVLYPTNPERTEDGSALNLAFLDGPIFSNLDGTTSSVDDFALMKFGGVFGAGQVPTNVPVAKAWVVLTTGDVSTAAHSPGPWSAYTMKRSWDTTTLHSSFGAVNGLQTGEGDISAPLDTQEGIVRGAEVWFDVTSYLEGVRTGTTDNGIAVTANGTADGWQIHANGSTTELARPKLVVYSADLGISNPIAGDFNDDGAVDGADFLAWQRGFTAGTLTQSDLATWKANFGAGASTATASPAAAAVPEPATAVIALMAGCGLVGAARRRNG